MMFPPVPFGPQEIIKASSIPVDNQVEIQVQRVPRVASINIDTDTIIRRQQRAEWFLRRTGRGNRSAHCRIEFPQLLCRLYAFYRGT